MWWKVPCKNMKTLTRAESRMDIEDILKMKLETIKEENEINDEVNGSLMANIHRKSISKMVIMKINHSKIRMEKLLTRRVRLKEFVSVFVAEFASRGGLNGLPRY